MFACVGGCGLLLGAYYVVPDYNLYILKFIFETNSILYTI